MLRKKGQGPSWARPAAACPQPMDAPGPSALAQDWLVDTPPGSGSCIPDLPEVPVLTLTSSGWGVGAGHDTLTQALKPQPPLWESVPTRTGGQSLSLGGAVRGRNKGAQGGRRGRGGGRRVGDPSGVLPGLPRAGQTGLSDPEPTRVLLKTGRRAGAMQPRTQDTRGQRPS